MTPEQPAAPPSLLMASQNFRAGDETAEEMEERLRIWEQRLQRWEQELRHKSVQMRTEAALKLPLASRLERQDGRGLLGEEAAMRRIADKLRAVEAMRSEETALVASNASTNSQTPRHAASDASASQEQSMMDPMPAAPQQQTEEQAPAPEASTGQTTPRGRTPADTPWSTPELPVRELPAELSAAAVDFFSRHLPSPLSANNCHGSLVSPVAAAASEASASPGAAPPSGSQLPPTLSTNHPVLQEAEHAKLPKPVRQPALAAPLWYRVAFIGGISVREAPDAVAPTTGQTLPFGEVFGVAERVPGVDHRLYLRLASGQGWVFDDAALYPEDPAVVEMSPRPSAAAASSSAAPPVLSTVPTVRDAEPAASPSNSGLFLPPAQLGLSPPAASDRTPPACGPEQTAQQLRLDHLPLPVENGLGPVYSDSASPSPYSSPSPQHSHGIAWYRVAFLGGISVRAAPDVDAPRTGLTLPLGEVFGVAESILGQDQRVYLRLSDGRGWVFDDSLLVPEDCSVVMIQPPASHVPHVYEHGEMTGVHVDERYGAHWQYGAMDYSSQPRMKQYWARGCRGGAKRNKWKKEAARLAAVKAISGASGSGAIPSVGSAEEEGDQTV
eukprot:TRINITY_DN14283_c0_g1_i1.p1 TRINITY_DN14283_c0_g1~~TRINITY_DN14283_c0_g1_i1.p1  ORF type:complete len:613 (+),score=119.27 TRINITY_DN14283_c0_g1_i1:64-1902(+)